MPRKPFARLLVALAFVLTLLPFGAARATGTLPAPGDYLVDPSGSTLGFNVTHFVVSSVDGRFQSFRGHAVVGASLAETRLEASADTASIDTGNATRDGHLRAEDNFDVAHFPSMTFVSTQLWGTADRFGLKGNLTIKGVTKEVVFTARVEDSGLIRAETHVERTDFGIATGGPVGNEVRIRLVIKLVKAA